MVLLYVLLGNLITIIYCLGLICVLMHNKDKIRSWLRRKKLKKGAKK